MDNKSCPKIEAGYEQRITALEEENEFLKMKIESVETMKMKIEILETMKMKIESLEQVNILEEKKYAHQKLTTN